MLMVMSTLDIKELLKIMGEKEKEKKKVILWNLSVAICKTPHPDQSE